MKAGCIRISPEVQYWERPGHLSLEGFFRITPICHMCVCVCVCARACVRMLSLSHTHTHTHTHECIQSCLTLCNPWTVAHQAPLSMEFSGQEYWSGLPFPSPGDLPNPGIVPAPLASPALAGGFFTTAHLGSPLTVLLRIYLQRFPKEMTAFSVLSLVLLWQWFSRGVVVADSAIL